MGKFKQRLMTFGSDTRGSFALMTSVFLLVLLLGVGIAYDTSNIFAAKQRLRDMADQTALAGAVSARDGNTIREQTAKEYFDTARATEDRMVIDPNPTIEFKDGDAEVRVNLRSKVDTAFMSLIGKGTIDISVETITSYAIEDIDPIKIAFALDVSGSMRNLTTDGNVKIDVLKDATHSLFASLEDGVENSSKLQTKLRTGFAAYNTGIVDETIMEGGFAGITSDIDALTADGGTNSTVALQAAYDMLQNDSGTLTDARRYIIFMTDGDNNQSIWDDESIALCNAIKAADIKLYSVAFAAPSKGELLLLKCASPSTDAPDPCETVTDSTDPICRAEKAQSYFDANDAAAFKAAFQRIGTDIAKQGTSIKS